MYSVFFSTSEQVGLITNPGNRDMPCMCVCAGDGVLIDSFGVVRHKGQCVCMHMCVYVGV